MGQTERTACLVLRVLSVLLDFKDCQELALMAIKAKMERRDLRALLEQQERQELRVPLVQ
jgi:hypothetical protein